jgi:Zn-finger nucleic acid-binding protein
MKLDTLLVWNRTQDDRGNTITINALREVRRQASIDPQLAAIGDRALAILVPNVSVWQCVQIGVAAMAVPLVTIAILGQGAFLWVYGPYLFLFPLIATAISARRRRRLAPRLTRVFIEEGICAGCGYTLEHLVESDDRMLVCPECSAAWKRDRILRFAPIAKVSKTRTLTSESKHFLRLMTESVQRRGVRDDRDSPRVVMTLRATRRVAAQGDHRERIDQVVEELKPLGRARRIIYAAVLTFMSAMLVFEFMIAVLNGVPPNRGSVLPAIFGLAQLSLAISAFRGDIGRPRETVQQAFITRQLCPCCAADLRDEPPESDGCTVCPGCRAAWRLGEPDREPDPVTPAPTPEPSPSTDATHQTPPSA